MITSTTTEVIISIVEGLPPLVDVGMTDVNQPVDV